jgi:peptidoglycan/xylan/chitin deacetylase (PgdA/CDA1 family)
MTPYMKKELNSGKIKSWYSPGIISFLVKNNISATVFTTGMFAEIYPDVIRKMSENPLFEIENHTYDHKSFTSNCYKLATVKNQTEKIQEITKTNNIIKKLTGKEPHFIRLPGLCSKKEDDSLIKRLGFISSDTGIISGDAKQKDFNKIKISVLNQVKRGDNVIILHLGGPNAPSTEKAITLLIPELQKRNYIFAHL